MILTGFYLVFLQIHLLLDILDFFRGFRAWFRKAADNLVILYSSLAVIIIAMLGTIILIFVIHGWFFLPALVFVVLALAKILGAIPSPLRNIAGIPQVIAEIIVLVSVFNYLLSQ